MFYQEADCDWVDLELGEFRPDLNDDYEPEDRLPSPHGSAPFSPLSLASSFSFDLSSVSEYTQIDFGAAASNVGAAATKLGAVSTKLGAATSGLYKWYQKNVSPRARNYEEDYDDCSPFE